MPLVQRWQEAVFFFAETPEPISGHYVIDAVTNGSRHQTKDTQPRPRMVELPKYDQRCAGLGVRSAAVDDDVCEVQRVGADSEFFSEVPTIWLSGRSELDIICRFMPKYELDPSAAKDAVSVENNNGDVLVAHPKLGYHSYVAFSIVFRPEFVLATANLDTFFTVCFERRHEGHGANGRLWPSMLV